MPSVYCTGCGEANPETSRFCSQCGRPLTRQPGERATETTSMIFAGAEPPEVDSGDDSVADVDALEALPPGTALLVVRRGPNAGSRFLLDSELTEVGRRPDSDIFLDDVTVSRRHAEFYRQGGRFAVRDVGSLNGTYVNRERIEEEAALSGGDEVQIGKFRLVFLQGRRSFAESGG
jgi:pSer/pThr/pTyr-binding forkhead associated (FHA) protein